MFDIIVRKVFFGLQHNENKTKQKDSHDNFILNAFVVVLKVLTNILFFVKVYQ